MYASRFKDVLERFAAELSDALQERNEPQLVQQIDALRILEFEISGPGNVVAMYTEPKPAGAFGTPHRQVLCDVRKGMVILDVVNGRIACIEVLGRGDVRARLREFRDSVRDAPS